MTSEDSHTQEGRSEEGLEAVRTELTLREIYAAYTGELVFVRKTGIGFYLVRQVVVRWARHLVAHAFQEDLVLGWIQVAEHDASDAFARHGDDTCVLLFVVNLPEKGCA